MCQLPDCKGGRIDFRFMSPCWRAGYGHGFLDMPKKELENDHLPNFHKINGNLYRGGQPTEEGIRLLAGMGITTIINFRDTQEKVQKERSIAESNDLRFLNMRLNNWLKPSDEDIHAILDEIQNPQNQPVFIHCKRGADRTGTVAAVYRMRFDGWTDRQAEKEAKEFGIGWWQVWMKDYIDDYYERVILRQ